MQQDPHVRAIRGDGIGSVRPLHGVKTLVHRPLRTEPLRLADPNWNVDQRMKVEQRAPATYWAMQWNWVVGAPDVVTSAPPPGTRSASTDEADWRTEIGWPIFR